METKHQMKPNPFIIAGFILFFNLNGFSQVIQDNFSFQLAEQFYREKNFTAALSIFESLLEKEPTNHVVFNRTWNTLFQLGRYQDAHSLITSQIKTDSDFYLYNDAARMSWMAGQFDRAKEEWNLLLTQFNWQQSVVRTATNSMVQVRAFDLAESAYLNYRQQNHPHDFTIELMTLYSQTLNAEKIGHEFLILLEMDPGRWPLIDNRLDQFFSDSLSSARILDIMNAARPSDPTPEYFKIIGQLASNTSRWKEAMQAYKAYDSGRQTNGSATNEFLSQFRNRIPEPLLISFYEEFASTFKDSPLIQSVSLQRVELLAQNFNSGKRVTAALKLFNNPQNKRFSAPMANAILTGAIRSDWPASQKVAFVDSLLQVVQPSDPDYWFWALGILTGDTVKIDKYAGTKRFSEQHPDLYLFTRLRRGDEIDSLRSRLISFAKDLKRKETPVILFHLIESVPVKSINFTDYQQIANAYCLEEVGLKKESRQQFEGVVGTSQDSIIVQLAKRGLYLADIQDRKNLTSVLSGLLTDLPVSPLLDEVAYQLGLALLNDGRVQDARTILELIITAWPESIYVPFARNELQTIRILLSS